MIKFGWEDIPKKLFDLQGNLRRTINRFWNVYYSYVCVYNIRAVYCDYKTVKKISHAVFVLTMFTTGDWNARGIKSTASSDLKACLRTGYQSGPPIQQYRCSAPGNPVRLAVSTSVHKPYKIYIAKNVNGHIIVTNWGKNAIVAVDRLGILRYSYSGKDRNFDVCSVETDSFGLVIVTDCKRGKIHMLDRDVVFLRYIIPKGKIYRPSAVCILDTGEMILGECLTGIAKRIKYLQE